MVMNGEFLMRLTNATVPAPMGPRFIHIVGARTLDGG